MQDAFPAASNRSRAAAARSRSADPIITNTARAPCSPRSSARTMGSRASASSAGCSAHAIRRAPTLNRASHLGFSRLRPLPRTSPGMLSGCAERMLRTLDGGWVPSRKEPGSAIVDGETWRARTGSESTWKRTARDSPR